MMHERLNLISLQEAMDLLGISRATIDRWRKDKQLPYIKIGKEIWIDKEKLQLWVERHAVFELHPPESAARPGDKDRVVTIGYQSGAALLWSPLIIKQLGLFEEELRLLNPYAKVRVQWINAPNGMELMEHLIAGRVHIASVGDYPIIAGRTLGRILPGFQPQVLAFDGKTRNGDGISMVVPAGNSVSDPKKLAAAPISIVGHSSSSYRLMEWMNVYGLQGDPIVYRGMGDCLSGIIEGKVGASVLWEPYLSWVQAIGAGVPLYSEGLGGDYLTGLVADAKWTGSNETIVVAYLKAHLRAHEFIRREPGRAASLIHAASGFPVDLIVKVLSQIRWDASLYSRDLHTLSRFHHEETNWPTALKRDSGVVEFRKQYLQEAVEALRLPVLPDSPLPGEWSSELVY